MDDAKIIKNWDRTIGEKLLVKNIHQLVGVRGRGLEESECEFIWIPF